MEEENKIQNMKLRDYFAGQIISNQSAWGLYSNGDYLGDEIAKRVYELADSMVVESKKRLNNK